MNATSVKAHRSAAESLALVRKRNATMSSDATWATHGTGETTKIHAVVNGVGQSFG